MDPQTAANDLATWFRDHAAGLIVAAIVLVVVSRVAKPAIHRLGCFRMCFLHTSLVRSAA